MSKPSFSSLKEALALPAPASKSAEHYPHRTQAGFFVRVGKARKDGKVLRQWVAAYEEELPDGNGGTTKKEKKEAIGLVARMEIGDDVMTYEDALAKVLEKRKAIKEAKVEGRFPRLTFGQAWALYPTEKALNREETLDKDTQTYERYLKHLEDKFMDEMRDREWTQYVNDILAGELLVGYVMRDGYKVAVKRNALANATAKGVMSVAANLYTIAHKYKGLQGFERGENPAAEAKKLIGSPNVRKGHITTDNLGATWIASNILIPPGWRDLFRVCVLTGLRRSLIWEMKFSQVEWDTCTLIIDPEAKGTKRKGKFFGTGKDKQWIRLPLSFAVLKILKARQLCAPDPNGWVWYPPPASKGNKKRKGEEKLGDQRFAWKTLFDIAKTDFSPHDLRRTFATLGSIVPGADIHGVSLLLLHTGGTLAKVLGIPEISIQYMNLDAAQKKMRDSANAIAAMVDKLAADALLARETAPEPDSLPQLIEEALQDIE